jgi:hypothetical protein
LPTLPRRQLRDLDARCGPFVGRQLQVGLETWMPRELAAALAAAAAAAAAAEQAMPAAE